MKLQNKIILLLSLMVMGFSAQAQSENHFLANIDKAREVATKEHKDILMVFAGSDWCKPCMQFKKEVLLSETFDTFQQAHLVVLYLDFPAKRKNKLSEEQTKHNENLAEKYNKNGAFPKILLFDDQEKLIDEIEYNHQTPEIFVSECKQLIAGK